MNASKSPETRANQAQRRGFVNKFQLVFYGTDRRLKLQLPGGGEERERRELQRDVQYLSPELLRTLRLYTDVEEPGVRVDLRAFECAERDECVQPMRMRVRAA